MAKINPLSNIWSVMKEADLRPIREQAERGVRIALVGAAETGRADLVERLRRDPARPEEAALNLPLSILGMEGAEQLENYDLIILMVDGRKPDTQREQALVQAWHARGLQTLVFVNYAMPQPIAAISPPVAGPADTPAPGGAASQPAGPVGTAPRLPPPSRSRGVVRGSVQDEAFLQREFSQAVIELLPQHVVALGRCFPFFRVPVAHYLINDTAFSNAAYAFSTALAEIVPVVSVPVAVADMIILTKNQLFLVYKLGLAVGFSTRWQDYVAEFGGVLGSGFLWRQAARTLVGMIPVWGIVPKTAVSYAGTYAVGSAVLQWYLTGRHISPDQVKSLYTAAFERGRQIAAGLARRAPKVRRPRLSAPKLKAPKIALPKLRRSKKPAALPESTAPKICPECGKANAPEARFCQYCGHVFD